MVFESIVVELVNKYLGDFVENFDKSQLKISLWGGDVVLKNLFIKSIALDDSVPVHVLHGNIGQLTLKIPWKSLYSEPTIAILDGLYVVAVPKSATKYDADKEAKAEWDAKQKELQDIEDAKKAKEEANKPQEPKQDTFAEKLATNVIKNLQVKVSNVHIRYEDRFTNPKKPFSIGITLKGLFFETTDSNWNPKIIKENVTMIYKSVKLDSLSVYWNSDTDSYQSMPRETALEAMKKNIGARADDTAYQYLIEPISSSAKLRMHTKPQEDNFSIPKMLLDLIFQEIAISLSKRQYQDALELLESLERMNLSSKFRKYRPMVEDAATGVRPLERKGNTKAWWLFAYNSVLEETVKRRRNMWSWQFIKKHRDTCRRYKEAYKKKLTAKKVPADVTKTLEECEKALNVFNITMLRQYAEVEVKKEGAKKAEEDSKKGWFSGWFGGGGQSEAEKADNFGDKFQAAMTADEKKKLYDAIGYSDAAADPTLPLEYVANKLNFRLSKLSVTLRDTEKVNQAHVMQMNLDEVVAFVGQRPAGSALKVETKIDSLTILGAPTSGGKMPSLAVSQLQEAEQHLSLLDLKFETNPLDGKCDTRVNLNARPLEIVYDASTINQLADFFKPPESVYLKQLQAAAMAQFDALKEQSATGLQYAIQEHKFTEINVDIKPTHIIIPFQGVYQRNIPMIVVDLGRLGVASEKQKMRDEEVSPTLSFEEVMESAYDKYKLSLSSVQVLYVPAGGDWKKVRTLPNSPMHLLKPLSLNIDFEKSILVDPKMPKMRIKGELPSLAVSISDGRLKNIMDLVQSIPFPESPPAPPETDLDYNDNLLAPDMQNLAVEADASKLLSAIPVEGSAEPPGETEVAAKSSTEYFNSVDVDLKFEIKEISLELLECRESEEVKMVTIFLESLGTSVKVCTFDLQVGAYLGAVYVQHTEFKAVSDGPLINLVNTPSEVQGDDKLLAIKYVKANKKGPDFATLYNNTEQKIEVHFKALELLVHQKALLSLMRLAQKLQPAPAHSLEPKVEAKTEVVVEKPAAAPVAVPVKEDTPEDLARRARMRERAKGIIDIAVEAKLDKISMALLTEDVVIADINIKGLEANVTVQKEQTLVSAGLKDITIYDPSKDTLYKKILSIEGKEVFRVNIGVYNDATAGEGYTDMSKMDTKVEFETGCMKFVFLMKFVNDLLRFVETFQLDTEKMNEAASAMAESAATAAAAASSRVSRIGLDIKLKAPLIIVPQKSTMPDALLVDLGLLTLKNSFSPVPNSSKEKDIPAILDSMQIKLTALKVSRAKIEEDNIAAEVLILEPVNISIDMIRNLSASWYHKHPDIDISGELEAFSVALSQGDFTVLMGMLSDNFGEQGQLKPAATPPATPAAQSQAAAKGAAKPAAQATPAAAGTSQAVAKPEPTPSTTEEAYTKMKFNFSIASINATLYTGDSSLISGIAKRDAANSLAHFDIQGIKVVGNMQSDNAMTASVALFKMVLLDSRPGREKGITSGEILRMVEKSEQIAKDSKVNMIDVSFTQTAAQDKDLKVMVNGLFICVCLEYVMTLSNFFVEGMPKPEDAPAAAAPAVKAAPTTTTTTEAPPAEAAPAPAQGKMSIKLVVDKPEIVLVEDPLNLNTNAVILYTHVEFDLNMVEDQQMIVGNIRDFNIISCNYAPDIRAETRTMILNPTQVYLLSKAIGGKEHRVNIDVSDIIMNVSPATIRIITATLSALSTTSDRNANGEEIKEVPMFPNLWAEKKLADCDYRFLKTGREAEEVNVVESVLEEEDKIISKGEQLIMNINKIVVKLEGGVGRRTLPLLVAELGFKAEVKEWSTMLSVVSDLTMEVAYYNEKLAVWEPIIEPIEDSEGHLRPWELSAEITQNSILPVPDDEVDNEPMLPQPKMTITVKSEDTIQTTMTKTCLTVLGNLGKAFGDAYNLIEEQKHKDEIVSPYVVKNDCGSLVTFEPQEPIELPPSAENGVVSLDHGSQISLFEKIIEKEITVQKSASVIAGTQEDVSRKLSFTVKEYNLTRDLNILRAEKRSYNIAKPGKNVEMWIFVCQMKASYGCKQVTFRSVLQLHNNMPYTLDVLYKDDKGQFQKCGEVAANGIFNVPLYAVYAPAPELYFKPQNAEYEQSSEPLNWKDLISDEPDVIECPSVNNSGQKLFFNAITDLRHIIHENTGEKTTQIYDVTLNPCAVFRNHLPVPVEYLIEGCEKGETVGPGERSQLLNCKRGTTIEVKMKYRDLEWVGRRTLEEKMEELSIWSFDTHDGSKKSNMDLGLHYIWKGHSELSLFCPYWMINKTGRTLEYKSVDDTVVTHKFGELDIVLFSFKSKSSKKKAALRVEDSEWSDRFSLDTVGSAGTVSCKIQGLKCTVGVNITLTSSGLTKIVTFSPYFLLVNQAPFTVSCKENENDAKYTDVPSGECVPFWPIQITKAMQMVVKVKDMDLETLPFSISDAHTTLLPLDHDFGGINVDIQVLESMVIVKMTQYQPGYATALIVNHTASGEISYSQHESSEKKTLKPGESALYTWQNPLEKRELVWSCGDKEKQKNDLIKDGIEEFFMDSETKLYWVSFLEGMQRVLLFTEDIALATLAQQAGELEQVEQEIIVSLSGLGLSLVNNVIQKEVAYMGITSSGVIWEMQKKRRFKALKMKHSTTIEAAYQLHQNEIIAGKQPKGRKALEGKLDVDFSSSPIKMFKPNKGNIFRRFENGIWMSYRTSPHQIQFHAKIHRLQLDNQLPGAVFQTVVSFVPPPKSVAAESVPKPFTEISVMIRKKDNSPVLQFKYCKVLVQEMSVKVDQGFLNAIMGMFGSEAVDPEYERTLFETDVKSTQETLMDLAGATLSSGVKNYYDMLHFSPLKIHLSFSMYSGGDDEDEGKQMQLGSSVAGLFLQSVGVMLTDIQDVIFKLGYFERNFTFYDQAQLQHQIIVHYSQQAIKQMYVLVLGLDVLGNPFGLIRGVAEGIEDLFYEPYQGAIQGPEEFAEGLALGMRSLFGHAVGGAAGAVSRITGALGKGIATLTLDDEYQKKRREQMAKKPTDMKEGLARGGKSLVMGVVDGFTGVVMKPVEGAKADGVGGFFKGAGKGLIGLVTRPASGVVDFASTSFEGLKRATEFTDEVRRLRPPRFLENDGIVRPYKYKEAMGNDVLQDIDKGKYVVTDVYIAHAILTPDIKNVLLVTSKRVLFATKGEIFGHWECEWQYTWPELKEPPTCTANGIQILLKERQKKSFLSSKSMGKSVLLQDRKMCEYLVGKMKEAMFDQDQ